MRPDNLDHIVAAAHQVDALVEACGGREETLRQIVRDLVGEDIPAAGRFEVIRLIGGEAVTGSGAVANGIIRSGTAFIP